jgi:hypothetical protein
VVVMVMGVVAVVAAAVAVVVWKQTHDATRP